MVNGQLRRHVVRLPALPGMLFQEVRKEEQFQNTEYHKNLYGND